MPSNPDLVHLPIDGMVCVLVLSARYLSYFCSQQRAHLFGTASAIARRMEEQMTSNRAAGEWVDLAQAVLYLAGRCSSFVPAIGFRAIRKPEHLKGLQQAKEQLVIGLATGDIRHQGVACVLRCAEPASEAYCEIALLAGVYCLPAACWDIDRIDFYNASINLPQLPEAIRQDLGVNLPIDTAASFRLRDITVSREDLFKIKPLVQSQGHNLRGGAPVQKDWDGVWIEAFRHTQEEGFPQDDREWQKLNKHLYDTFTEIDEFANKSQNESAAPWAQVYSVAIVCDLAADTRRPMARAGRTRSFLFECVNCDHRMNLTSGTLRRKRLPAVSSGCLRSSLPATR